MEHIFGISILISGIFIISRCHSQTDRVLKAETKTALHGNGECNCTLIKQDNVDALELDCSHKNFHSVPTCHELLPYNCSHITRLKLNNNNIAEIQNGSFTGFDNVRTLSLASNPIRTFDNDSFIGMYSLVTLDIRNVSHPKDSPFRESKVEPEAFRGLQHLKYIDFSSVEGGTSSYDLDSLWKSFCSLPNYMESLIANDVYQKYGVTVTLTEAKTHCLGKKFIKKLGLNQNWITVVNNGSVFNLRHVESVTLYKNKIVGDKDQLWYLAFFTNLSSVNASCQNARHCDEKDVNSTLLSKYRVNTNYTEKKLQCSDVKTSHTKVCGISNLTFLDLHRANIYFSKINFTHLQPSGLCWVNNLKYIDISYNKVTRFDSPIFCMERLKFLNIRSVDAEYMNPKVFQEMPSLEILQMGNNRQAAATIFKNESFVHFLFEKNKKLKFLDLSSNALSSLDQVTLNQLNSLVGFDLSFNEITNSNILNISIKHDFPYLRYVSLEGNKLTTIPLNLLRHLETVFNQNKTLGAYLNIYKNKFICTCNMIMGILHIFKSNIKVEKRNLLTCMVQTVEGLKERNFTEALPYLYEECRKWDMVSMIFLTVIYPLVLVTILISTCLYNNRRRIRFLLTANFLLNKSTTQDNVCFMFDAFVSYSTKDNFVLSQLVPRLESGPNPYRLCLQDRNFRPGAYTAETILAAIESSKVTILVVSKGYLRSNWLEFNINAVQKHHMREPSRRIIALLLPSYQKSRKNYSTNLQNLLENVTTVEWPTEKHEEELVWLKLIKALGKPESSRYEWEDTSSLIHELN